ncbi:MAG TPA: VWA domain-containing protein [Anaerolineae bacterium]|nr:VWA domain-containing protein [Anaerolineae bacterium]
MSWAHPEWLSLLLLLPVCGLVMVWAEGRRAATAARLGNPALVAQLQLAVNERGRRWQRWLWLLGLGLMIVALARPQWGTEVQVVTQEGVQVMVALDVSASMLATDLKPSRLVRARQEIADLMARLEGDEVGLVLFSGASFIQFPLTSDYGTARAFLDAAEPGIISRPGTVIGEAIETAMSGFDEQRSGQKVIVIMTDGEDHETEPLAMAQAAAREGVVIYTIGFGSAAGAPVPEYDEGGALVGYKRTTAGETVLSQLNERSLQEIAAAGNGRYFRATASGEELDELVRLIDELETAQMESRFQTTKIERFQWFLGLGLVCLVWYQLIPERVREKGRRRRPSNVIGLMLMMVVLSGCGPTAAELIAQGNAAYEAGDYEAAGEFYRQAEMVAERAPEPVYNQANAAYRQAAYAEAEVALQGALAEAGLEDEQLTADTFFNLGNSYYQQEKWSLAIAAYQETLRLRSDDVAAKYNLELAWQKLVEEGDGEEKAPDEQETEDEESSSGDDQGTDENESETDETEGEEDQPESGESENEGGESEEETEGDESIPQPGDEGTEDIAGEDATQTEAGENEGDSEAPAAGQSRPREGLTATQARQLLENFGNSTQTLQQRLQQIFVVPGAEPPDKDW